MTTRAKITNARMARYWDLRAAELEQMRPMTPTEKEAEIARLGECIELLEKALVLERHMTAAEKIAVAGGRGPGLGARIATVNKAHIGDIVEIRRHNSLVQNRICKMQMRLDALMDILDTPAHYAAWVAETVARQKYYRGLMGRKEK